MEVPREDRVVSALKQSLHVEPACLVEIVLHPDRLVETNEDPAHVRVARQHLLEILDLLLADRPLCDVLARIVGVDSQEKYVLVEEVIVPPAEAFLPDIGLDGIGHIVIAWHVEERHLQLLRVGLEFLPFAGELGGVLRIAFDEVADGNDEGRLQEIDLLNRL